MPSSTFGEAPVFGGGPEAAGKARVGVVRGWDGGTNHRPSAPSPAWRELTKGGLGGAKRR
jgi:hypothetical protein